MCDGGRELYHAFATINATGVQVSNAAKRIDILVKDRLYFQSLKFAMNANYSTGFD